MIGRNDEGVPVEKAFFRREGILGEIYVTVGFRTTIALVTSGVDSVTQSCSMLDTSHYIRGDAMCGKPRGMGTKIANLVIGLFSRNGRRLFRVC